MTVFWKYTELNAILSMCRILRIALYFFEPAVKLKSLKKVANIEVMISAYPLTAENEGLEQSFAICLAASQNIHSLLSKYCFCFAESNISSLPRTEMSSSKLLKWSRTMQAESTCKKWIENEVLNRWFWLQLMCCITSCSADQFTKWNNVKWETVR